MYLFRPLFFLIINLFCFTIFTVAQYDSGAIASAFNFRTLAKRPLTGHSSLYSVSKNTYNIDSSLVNPNSSTAAKALYDYLRSQFGVKIISGQTSDYYDSIKAITGRSPLLRGFDFQHYTMGYSYKWINGGHSFGWDDSYETEKAITWYNQTGKKGIVSFQWHWHSPTGGQAGKNTFYTQFTSFDASKAVVPGNQEYTDIIRDIDSIATQLRKLKNAGVPVIFRPLHEASGSGAVDGSGAWFWWGAKGANVCRKLYGIIYDRLANHHSLNNLIWTWSSPETAWYPGNDSIDMIGHDSYPGAYNYGNRKSNFDILYNLTGGHKLIAMTENGPIPNPDDCLTLDAPWSCFMSWSNLVKTENSLQHLKDVFNNTNVLILEPSKAKKPTGSAVFCPNPENQTYTTRKVNEATSYLWKIFPTGAGTVTGTDTIATVDYSNTYTGKAQLVVSGRNSLGIGQSSDSLIITINSTPGKPAKPFGVTLLYKDPPVQIYNTAGVAGATSYTWSLIPDSAGISTGTGNRDTIDFNNTFTGKARLIVFGNNACGKGIPSDTLAITIQSGVAVKKTEKKARAIIAPNPSSGLVEIKVDPNVGNFDMDIVNIYGLILSSKKGIDSEQLTLDLSYIPNGNYFITIQTEHSGVINERLMIQR